MFIPIILGTARKGRQSEKVANFMIGEVKKYGLETEILDVKDFRTEATDRSEQSPQVKKLAEIVKRSDALIIVTPEYNHGYPGELKMMLDMLYEEYRAKPVGFCGVSAGPIGGARAVEQLRQVAVEFHMLPIRESLYFPLVQNLFNEKGMISHGSYGERIKVFLDELAGYVKKLKS